MLLDYMVCLFSCTE